jgi:hypothetical protein
MWCHAERPLFVMVLMLAVVIVPASAAFAAAPANDAESAATEITQVPFSETIDTTDATASGPRFCSNNASVFYRFTPASDVRIQVDTIGSDYDTLLAIYTRNAAGTVVKGSRKCNDDRFDLDSGLRLQAKAGVTYFFQVASCCGNGGDGGGQLALSVTEVTDEPLEFTLDVTDPGTVDPATGIATISGTVTCNQRSVVGFEGVLRQLRNGMFVARGYVSAYTVCTPGATPTWTSEVDTDTGIAFGAGSALFRTWYMFAADGFRQYVEQDGTDTTIQLVSG